MSGYLTHYFFPGAQPVVFHLLYFSATGANNLGSFPSLCMPREVLYLLGSQPHETLMTQCPTETKLHSSAVGLPKYPHTLGTHLSVLTVTG